MLATTSMVVDWCSTFAAHHSQVSDFGANFVANLLSGVALAAIAWIWARVPNITGTWTVRITTKASAYNPYRNLEVTYIVLLSQHGKEVAGIAEKVYERRPDGSEYEHVGIGRKRSEIIGGLKGNAFQQKRFHLLFRESGHKRDYASIHQVKMDHVDLLTGEFFSTAANSSGTTKWTRGLGSYNFKLSKD